MAFGTKSGVILKSQAGSVGLQNAGLNMLRATGNPLKQCGLPMRLLCLPYFQETGGTLTPRRGFLMYTRIPNRRATMSRRYANHCMALVLLTIALSSAARADQSGNTTLAANTFLNLDTGVVSSTGGDLLWNGTTLTPQGRAETYNLGKYGSRAFKAIRARDASAAAYSPAPIPAGTLVAGDVFGVHTNDGNYAKAIVTAVDGTSLSLQYTIFIATASAIATGSAAANPAPVITQLQNNYSFILSGLPNYGIAPGSLFIIIGTGLSTSAPPVLQSSAAPGLLTSLNQTSISVTIGGVTTTPALYYTSATQVAAVLPSITPVGTGTLTLTSNGQASAPVPIQVVASAVGLDSLYGTGNGAGVATDNGTGIAFGLTNSLMPGQVAVFWGSGIGADTSNDDRTFPLKQNNLTNIPMQVYVGGISATILYRGRSQYPGVDQIDITIPANVSSGCFVSVVAVSGSIASNTVTVPVNPSGGPCSDPASGLNGSQLQSLANKGAANVNSAVLLVNQQTSGNGTVSSSAFAIMGSISSANYGKGYEYASQGSCIIVPPEQGSFENVLQAPLDAGTIQLTGPSGNVNLAAGGGFYQAQLPAGSVTGTYTFTGSGGKDIGSFKVALNIQAPLTWTNRAALASITRSQGATVTWSGGFSNGDVQVNGAVGDKYGSVRFYCHTPSSAGQLTIPSSILLGMPPGGGSLVVTNATAPQTVSASGIDVGLAIGTVLFKLDATFK